MPRFVLLDTEKHKKENLGVAIKSLFTKEVVKKLATSFVDENDFVADREKDVEKMTTILTRHTTLHEATLGCVKCDKTYFFS